MKKNIITSIFALVVAAFAVAPSVSAAYYYQPYTYAYNYAYPYVSYYPVYNYNYYYQPTCYGYYTVGPYYETQNYSPNCSDMVEDYTNRYHLPNQFLSELYGTRWY